MRLRGRTGLLALVAFVAAAIAMPARTTTIGVATVPAFCTHDLSAEGQPDTSTDCTPLTDGILVSSGPVSRLGAMSAPERRAMSDLSPRSTLLAARGFLLRLFADGVTRSRRSDVPMLRIDLGSVRSALVGMGPIPIGVPVMNVAAPVAGIDASDFVFPGEAAARVLLWRRQGGVAEWTGIWGTVVIPMPSGIPERPELKRPAPIKPLYTPVRSPLNLSTIPPPRRVARSGTPLALPAQTGGGLSAVPAPVPLPPAWAGFGAAIALLAALRLGRRPAKES
ncbi:hypothetical protein DEA8626_01910 [Defluviimonas aquaemixtae]|uniref:Uncharacterized protein n=1 Tax=Albidovulum aquaemixtae TaxID=1542388 RepID=A0A2R8B755_9RHOB|nr:hypothetical protein [Defluviimonas aquaemixtae]SPH18372.1 hypothetical protein DEA8626_01910 [Defluviimonas aquaemixtae]